MKLKVCGMRDPKNIAEVAGLVPDLMGFIFYEKSPRFAGGTAPESLDCLSGKTKRVGVFVNAPMEYIREITGKYSLDYIQLHGDESPEVCRALGRLTGVIKAFGIASADDLRKVGGYEGLCDYYVFDTKTTGYGGSGKKFDHGILSAYNGETPYLLSGGIAVDDHCTPRSSGCVGFDINSRFEISPGLKDASMIKRFMEKINNQ